MKKLLLASVLLIFLALGCVGNEERKETKLQVNQGLGVINVYSPPDFTPKTTGTFSITVRNNLEGFYAKNVIATLENVRPFKIFDCGKENDPLETRSCSGSYELDKGLLVSQHGVKMLAPGQEIIFTWYLVAPSSEEIANIALEHPLYYLVEYDYAETVSQNIVMIHEKEYQRIIQSNESLPVGTSFSSAGELRVYTKTPQPIRYQFVDSAVPITLIFELKNEGSGYPVSDVLLVAQLPKGIGSTESTEAHGWYSYEDFNEDCYNGSAEIDCKEWLEEMFKDYDFSKGNFLIKKLDHTLNFQDVFVYLPVEVTQREMSKLKSSNTLSKTYPFSLYIVYRYATEGKTYIKVYPLGE